VLIPVKNGVSKQLWAVETDMYYVIPSYGDEEDVIIQDRNLRSVIVMLCQVIGVSRDGEEVHAEWCNDVFPPEIYNVPQKLAAIPNNFIFVRPVGQRSWIRGSLRQHMNGLRHVHAQMYKTLQKYEQQIAELHVLYGNLNLHRIQVGNEMNLSNWQYATDAWDYCMRERTLPLSSVARLLNVSNSKLAYSTLHTVLSHGGMNDASKFVSAISKSVQSLASSIGFTLVSTPIQKALNQKLYQQQNDLIAERERGDKTMGALKDLARQVREVDQLPPAQESHDEATPKTSNTTKPINV
jgi:hypothetical protein